MSDSAKFTLENGGTSTGSMEMSFQEAIGKHGWKLVDFYAIRATGQITISDPKPVNNGRVIRGRIPTLGRTIR